MAVTRLLRAGLAALLLSGIALGAPQTLLAARVGTIHGSGRALHDDAIPWHAARIASTSVGAAGTFPFDGRYQIQYTLAAGVANLTGSFTATVAGAGIVDIRLVVHAGSAGCISATGTGSLDTDVGDGIFIQVAGKICALAGHPHLHRIALLGQVTGGTASFNGASGRAFIAGAAIDTNVSGTAGAASGAWVGTLTIPG